MRIKTKVIIALILLALIDTVIPVPILGIILLYVIFEKPSWFTDAVRDIYNDKK